MNKKININGKDIELELGTPYRLEIEGTEYVIDCCLKSYEALYRDPHWLREAYETKGYSMAKIADICSVTPMAIQNWLRRHNIQTRPRGYQTKD